MTTMTPDKAKFLAMQVNCEMWWERQWKVWALKHKDADEVEASGGCYMSSGELRSLTFDQMCARATAAAEKFTGD